ncbi:hypothetical protein [Spiroplasma endosymbiont of Ammophila pubescens]|uniref:hypothetical protein n=1 Tax=Spiroplasma endosymbiont of Ammophila pubescens TaxID=3066315 RepID=UPI0032B260C3
MKKLLSLLSVLTISGSAIPTTIAASPYQKDKHRLTRSVDMISNAVYFRGGMYIFQWRLYKKEFYWILKMHTKACKLLVNYLNSIKENIAGEEGAGKFITNISPYFVPTIPAAANAISALNFYLTSELIQQNNRGKGIWIGFLLNQPGIEWGSL